MSRSALPPGRLKAIAEGVYGYVQPDGSWWVNNAGLVASEGEALLFDTCATAARTDALIAAISEATTARVRTLVNSHDHSDHTHGNSRFPDAVVIAHPTVKTALERRGIVRGATGFTPFEVGDDIVLRTPDVTFDGSLTVWVGSLRCELVAAGRPAHSVDDVVAWLPTHGVLFAGDLVFNGVTPLFMSGSVAGTARVLEEVLTPLGAEHVLPGHGPLGNNGTIDAVLHYCDFVERLADNAHRRGLSALDAARGAELGEFEHWLDAERLVGNLHRALAERAGVAPGERLDYELVMADMAALSGRPLLETLA